MAVDLYNNNIPSTWDSNIAVESLNIVDSNKLLEQEKKQKKRKNKKRSQPRFGIAFDVDGVLARGTLALPQAEQMIRTIVNDNKQLQVPVVFVTNALNRNDDKANQISNWFNIQVLPKQMIQAQGPLEIFTKFHKKYCLIVGQGKVQDIAKECGFTNICTLDQVKEAYPLLDMVDHSNRKHIAMHGYVEKDLPRIEAIVLMGEPDRWESYLQLLIDLLVTDGKPNAAPDVMPVEHLPIIACNTDLLFMDRACMPRYGHGAFLVCLEALYKKVSGHELKYSALIGKPSEITFRYAEHLLAVEAKRLGIEEPLERMYLIGDTPEADIVGANLYQRYVRRLYQRRNSIEPLDENTKNPELVDPELPSSRNVPAGCKLFRQSVREVESLLVSTGVYKPGTQPENDGDEKNYKGHKDFPFNPTLYKPTRLFDDVHEAVQYIINKENHTPTT